MYATTAYPPNMHMPHTHYYENVITTQEFQPIYRKDRTNTTVLQERTSSSQSQPMHHSLVAGRTAQQSQQIVFNYNAQQPRPPSLPPRSQPYY